jgi:hypothetical protein
MAFSMASLASKFLSLFVKTHTTLIESSNRAKTPEKARVFSSFKGFDKKTRNRPKLNQADSKGKYILPDP